MDNRTLAATKSKDNFDVPGGNLIPVRRSRGSKLFVRACKMLLARKSGFVVMNNGESGYEMIEKSLMKDLLTRFV